MHSFFSKQLLMMTYVFVQSTLILSRGANLHNTHVLPSVSDTSFFVGNDESQQVETIVNLKDSPNPKTDENDVETLSVASLSVEEESNTPLTCESPEVIQLQSPIQSPTITKSISKGSPNAEQEVKNDDHTDNIEVTKAVVNLPTVSSKSPSRPQVCATPMPTVARSLHISNDVFTSMESDQILDLSKITRDENLDIIGVSPPHPETDAEPINIAPDFFIPPPEAFGQKETTETQKEADDTASKSSDKEKEVSSDKSENSQPSKSPRHIPVMPVAVQPHSLTKLDRVPRSMGIKIIANDKLYKDGQRPLGESTSITKGLEVNEVATNSSENHSKNQTLNDEQIKDKAETQNQAQRSQCQEVSSTSTQAMDQDKQLPKRQLDKPQQHQQPHHEQIQIHSNQQQSSQQQQSEQQPLRSEQVQQQQSQQHQISTPQRQMHPQLQQNLNQLQKNQTPHQNLQQQQPVHQYHQQHRQQQHQNLQHQKLL